MPDLESAVREADKRRKALADRQAVEVDKQRGLEQACATVLAALQDLRDRIERANLSNPHQKLAENGKREQEWVQGECLV